jgi:hypothetical protein
LDGDDQLVDYQVVDYPAGQPADEVQSVFNSYGANGWQLSQVDIKNQRTRRAVFILGTTAEYLVVDYDTGEPTDDLSNFLDGYGVDGWQLAQVDLLTQRQRRAIFMRVADGTGSGGGFPEAPTDGVTYGRMNATWNPTLALSNDILDGGNF